MILESGYEVLHVSELDYKNNKQEIIDKRVAFLTKNSIFVKKQVS